MATGAGPCPWRDSANVATDVQALLSEKPQFVQVIDPAQRGTRHSSSVSGKYLVIKSICSYPAEENLRLILSGSQILLPEAMRKPFVQRLFLTGPMPW